MDRQHPLRPDPHFACGGIKTDDIKRFGLAADLQPLALADGEVNDALVLAERLARRRVDNRAGRRTLGPDLGDDLGVVAVGHEADVLAVGLGRVPQARRFGQSAHLRLGHPAQRKAQVIELRLGGAVKKIRLVARRIEGAVQLRSVRCHDPLDIVPGGKAIRPQFARHAEQVGEFRPHVAADAGHRRASSEVFVGELFDHVFAESAFMVEDIMGDTQPVGHGARIANVIARAACALAPGCRAIIVKLERDADHLGPAGMGKRGDNRGIHPAAHCHDDPAVGCGARQVEQGGGIGTGKRSCLKKSGHGHGSVQPYSGAGRVSPEPSRDALVGGRLTNPFAVFLSTSKSRLYHILTTGLYQAGEMFEKTNPASGHALLGGASAACANDSRGGAGGATAIRHGTRGGDALRMVEWDELTARLSAARDFRMLLKHEAQRNIEGVAASFGDAAASYFQTIEQCEPDVNLDTLEPSKASCSIPAPLAASRPDADISEPANTARDAAAGDARDKR